MFEICNRSTQFSNLSNKEMAGCLMISLTPLRTGSIDASLFQSVLARIYFWTYKQIY